MTLKGFEFMRDDMIDNISYNNYISGIKSVSFYLNHFIVDIAALYNIGNQS